MKGSYYANPCFPDFSSAEKEDGGARLCYSNKWPTKEMPELQPAFEDLGSFINDLGVQIGGNLDKYVKSK